ncbi:protein kinase [Actinoplanes sp. OR16]|uniref:serine/threonine-protein kinase n=1 Tax=Actinoplanes sp. OR16 TaxID=946334 RepID=UPI003519E7A7
MGRVWLAHDEMLHREIAIKEIVPPAWMSGAEQERLRDRTLREARSAARLSHPHVVRIYDVVHAGGLSWIVMEYIPSRSLHEVLNEEGPYDPAGAARIGLAVLDALDAAHQAGVLHRDVKPHNVLIGVDGRVVLTDFGLATFVDDGSVTMPGLIVGSPQYVSPERARDGASTVESDLWSFGATLYAAVEGRSPYARETAMATLAALATEPPDRPVRAGPLTPILLGLLRYEPANRFTAAEVERRLLDIVATDHRATPLVPGRRPPAPWPAGDFDDDPPPAAPSPPRRPGVDPAGPFDSARPFGSSVPFGMESGEVWYAAEPDPPIDDGPLSVGDWHTEDSGLLWSGSSLRNPPEEPAEEKWQDIPETGNDPYLTGIISLYGAPAPATPVPGTSLVPAFRPPVRPASVPPDDADDARRSEPVPPLSKNDPPPAATDAPSPEPWRGSRELVLATPVAFTGAVLDREPSKADRARARFAVVSVLLVLLGSGILAAFLSDGPGPRVVLPPANTVLPGESSKPALKKSRPARSASPKPSTAQSSTFANPTAPLPTAHPPAGNAPPATAPMASSHSPTPAARSPERSALPARPAGFSPLTCDAPSPAGLPRTPKKTAARGVNGWTLPTGWSYFTDGSGPHLAVPDGWTYQRVGETYCFRDPVTSRVISLDLGRSPSADPLAACRAEDERLREQGGIRGYDPIAITTVPLLHKAADWEFRYRAPDASPRRATTRWLTMENRAYALGWSTSEPDWKTHQAELDMVRTTFYATTQAPETTASQLSQR